MIGVALTDVVLFASLPAVVWLATAAPACAWVAVICLLTRRQPEPLALTVAAVLGGAVLAAWPASHISQGMANWIGSTANDAAARWAVPAVVVPAVEELAKAAALVLLSTAVRNPRLDVGHGMRRGALIGIGFSALENTQYLMLALIQGGTPGLWRAAYVRGVVGGLHHAVYAATAGAGIGCAFTASRTLVRIGALVTGLAAAIAQHVAWNAAAAGRISSALCDAPYPDGPCRLVPSAFDLFVTTPLIATLALGPGIIALLAVAAISAHRSDNVR